MRAGVTRECDSLGRRMPFRLGVISCMRGVPGLAAQFREIPAEYWRDDELDGVRHALVCCPCGVTPQVPIGGMNECHCGRYFFFTGKRIYAAGGPNSRPKQSPTSAPPEPTA